MGVNGQMDEWIQTDRQMEMDRQTDRQEGRQAGRQKNRNQRWTDTDTDTDRVTDRWRWTKRLTSFCKGFDSSHMSNSSGPTPS